MKQLNQHWIKIVGYSMLEEWPNISREEFTATMRDYDTETGLHEFKKLGCY